MLALRQCGKPPLPRACGKQYKSLFKSLCQKAAIAQPSKDKSDAAAISFLPLLEAGAHQSERLLQQVSAWRRLQPGCLALQLLRQGMLGTLVC